MKLVSAIMPTRGRSEWAMQAIECFMAQTYPDKEIVILDDLNDRSFPDGVQPLLAYFKVPIIYVLSESRSIPQKRNECCRLAKGEIIVHWDSDDWSSPSRIADQVERLEESGKAVTGYYSMFFRAE